MLDCKHIFIYNFFKTLKFRGMFSSTLYCTEKTSKKLTQLPPFLNIKTLVLIQLPETSDVKDFCDFVKNHPGVGLGILFHESVSQKHQDSFKNQIPGYYKFL